MHAPPRVSESAREAGWRVAAACRGGARKSENDPCVGDRGALRSAEARVGDARAFGVLRRREGTCRRRQGRTTAPRCSRSRCKWRGTWTSSKSAWPRTWKRGGARFAPTRTVPWLCASYRAGATTVTAHRRAIGVTFASCLNSRGSAASDVRVARGRGSARVHPRTPTAPVLQRILLHCRRRI